MIPISTPLSILKTIFVFILFILATSEQTSAQIAFTSNANLKAETKRNRKEAAHIEAEYKETHLNMGITYRKGEASHKQAKAQTKWGIYQDEKYDDVIYTKSAKTKNNRKVSLKKITHIL